MADDIGTQVEEDSCFSISSRGDLNNIRNPTFVNKKTIQRRFQCFINASETRVYAGHFAFFGLRVLIPKGVNSNNYNNDNNNFIFINVSFVLVYKKLIGDTHI